jgi:(R)-2-hydroxyglutarate---pyruvate transhydrogenase
MLEQWHATIYIQSELQTPVYWIRDLDGPGGQIPFEQNYVFTEGVTALAMVYYWAALVIFHPCIQRLYDAIYEPTVDGFWKSFSEDPAGMQREPVKYAPDKVREMADNVCRSLDFALEATVQPDTLLFPLLIAQDYYGNIGRGYSAGDGQLEMMWCDAFRARLTRRGREIADVVRSKRWYDMAQY